MALFGFRKKKEPAPAPKPEQKQVEIKAEPYEMMVRIDGQWYYNPNYDPSAPKPQHVEVYGLGDDDDDDDDEEKEEDDADF